MNNYYGPRAVKKYCLKCGFSMYLCPDVEHDCPVCGAKMVKDEPVEKRRCSHRARKISWCNLKKRFCDSPNEYERCEDYEPKRQ
jgi:hypothetical protein